MVSDVSARVNRNIRVSHVLLIDEEGNNLGKVPISDALKRAEDSGLDLVEVSSGKNGIVCRIMDYGKWKYQNTKKAKKNMQHKKVVKEINIRPNTGYNDLKYRAKQVDKFIEAENKVKLVVKFKGREQAHAYETGKNIIEKFLKLINVKYAIYDVAKSDGRTISLMLNPSKEEK
jgi:translation initiation factor IF-3